MLIEGKYAKKIDSEWPEDHTFISKRSKDDLNRLFCRCYVDISSQGKGAFTGRLAGHKSNVRAAGTPSLKLVFREATSQDDQIPNAELSHPSSTSPTGV